MKQNIKTITSIGENILASIGFLTLAVVIVSYLKKDETDDWLPIDDYDSCGATDDNNYQKLSQNLRNDRTDEESVTVLFDDLNDINTAYMIDKETGLATNLTPYEIKRNDVWYDAFVDENNKIVWKRAQNG